MKFQNCFLKKISDEWTDGRTHGHAQSNMPLQLGAMIKRIKEEAIEKGILYE